METISRYNEIKIFPGLLTWSVLQVIQSRKKQGDFYNMTISEAAERLGMTHDTLRYYERIGLIPPVPRDKSGRRDYDEESCNWISLMKCLRDVYKRQAYGCAGHTAEGIPYDIPAPPEREGAHDLKGTFRGRGGLSLIHI